jgi:hypothetical protein
MPLTGVGLQSTFFGCKELESVVLPTTVGGITSIQGTFNNCNSLKSALLPNFGSTITNLSTAFQDTWSLRGVTFGGSMTNGSINLSSMFNRSSFTSANFNLFGQVSNPQQTIINADTLGTSAPFCATYSLTGTRFSKLDISGNSINPNGGVKSLRLSNSSLTGQWGGSSPQINISFTGIDYTNLILLFNDIAGQGTIASKTINISGCTGASSLTASDRLILTSKGWTITG